MLRAFSKYPITFERFSPLQVFFTCKQNPLKFLPTNIHILYMYKIKSYPPTVTLWPPSPCQGEGPGVRSYPFRHHFPPLLWRADAGERSFLSSLIRFLLFYFNFLSSVVRFLLFFSISYHLFSISYHRFSISYFFFQFPIIAFQFPINGHPIFPLFFNFLSTVGRFFHFFSISYHRVSISYQRSSVFSTFFQFPINGRPDFPLFLNFLSSRFNFLLTVGPIFYFFSISNPRSSISCSPFRFPLSHFIISSLSLPSPPFFPSHTYIYSIIIV